VRRLVLGDDARKPLRLALDVRALLRLGIEGGLQVLERQREVQDRDVARRDGRPTCDRREGACKGAACGNRAGADAGLLQKRRAGVAGDRLSGRLLDSTVAVELVYGSAPCPTDRSRFEPILLRVRISLNLREEALDS
jgi:hypothetical protein